MSILIKGMKMPGSCTMCWLSPICPVWVKEVSRHKGYDDRLPDCPLVEVPTPHGRLIDADDAATMMMFGLCGTGHQAKANLLKSEYYAPTIIEAEEGEDHEKIKL